MNVTIFTKPNCVQCEATKRWLDRENVTYSTVDLSQNADAMHKILDLGYTSAPVVITDTDSWSGFRINKIQDLIAEIKSKK
jgi:glutaredoxin-like protein NrdH